MIGSSTAANAGAAARTIVRRHLASTLLKAAAARGPTMFAAAQGQGQLAVANYSQATLASRRPAAAAAAIHRDGGTYYNGASHSIDTSKADRDYVKSAIHRLLTTPDLSSARTHSKTASTISDRALEDAAKAFQFQLDEARSCVKDCADVVEQVAVAAAAGNDSQNKKMMGHHKIAADDEWEGEYEEAETALEAGAAALIDFLDALNHATEQQRLKFGNLRSSSGSALKELRWQLQQLQERRQHLQTTAAAAES